MMFRFLLLGLFGGVGVWAQELRVPSRCPGPECAERVRVKERRPSGRVQRQAESRVDRYGRPRPRPQAERYRFSLPAVRHRILTRAERHRYEPPSPRHKPYPERWAYQPPQIPHREAGERFRLSPPLIRHRPTPEKVLYALPAPRHRPVRQSPCERPALSHPTQKWTQAYSCEPAPLRHSQKAQRTACAVPAPRHAQSYQVATCQPRQTRHRQGHQRLACQPPSIRHPQAYQRATCRPPVIPHRHPENYVVPCDAQRRGVMTQTQRFAHDLRYLFTNHRKHCEVQSAYSGISIGEWVNTERFGRVPVVAYRMGWRVYQFAHFYDKNGHRFKKPRIEKRKVRALYQIQVLVPQPGKKVKSPRRYIKGLPGIEGVGATEGEAIEPVWLSPGETRAIQIEKLVRKRQVAWLVRAYPEEQVRLREWLRKYAGPKPEHLWPGVDYRLLEVWQ